jgi:predicted membrane protein
MSHIYAVRRSRNLAVMQHLRNTLCFYIQHLFYTSSRSNETIRRFFLLWSLCLFVATSFRFCPRNKTLDFFFSHVFSVCFPCLLDESQNLCGGGCNHSTLPLIFCMIYLHLLNYNFIGAMFPHLLEMPMCYFNMQTMGFVGV